MELTEAQDRAVALFGDRGYAIQMLSGKCIIGRRMAEGDKDGFVVQADTFEDAFRVASKYRDSWHRRLAAFIQGVGTVIGETMFGGDR